MLSQSEARYGEASHVIDNHDHELLQAVSHLKPAHVAAAPQNDMNMFDNPVLERTEMSGRGAQNEPIVYMQAALDGLVSESSEEPSSHEAPTPSDVVEHEAAGKDDFAIPASQYFDKDHNEHSKEMQNIINEAKNDTVNMFRMSVNQGEIDFASLLGQMAEEGLISGRERNEFENDDTRLKLQKAVCNGKHCKPRWVQKREMAAMIAKKREIKAIRAAKCQRRLEKHLRRQGEAFAESPAGRFIGSISNLFGDEDSPLSAIDEEELQAAGLDMILEGNLDSEEEVIFQAQLEPVVEAGRTQYYNIADPRDPVVEEPSDQWFPSKKIQPPSASSTSKGQKRKNRKKH